MRTSFREYFTKAWGHDGEVQINFLDTIDFFPFFTNGKDLDEIRRDIEDEYDYGHKRDKMPPELHQCAFNFMDDFELGWYLEERYPDIKVEECVKTWYEIRLKR